jgi:MoaA/NifB/PqqE/SkfB family radical SAM enzyme/GT2 family glycosyltransferase
MSTKEVKELKQTKNDIIQKNSIDLAVCILFLEKPEQTIECIQSFIPSGVNIYILNNGSSLSTRNALGEFCDNYKQIKIFDSDKNLGVGVGRNYLITHTNEEWLLFVDSDITIKTSNWMQKFTQHVNQYPDVEVFIPKLFNVSEGKYAAYKSIRISGDKAIHDVEIRDNLTNTFPGGAAFTNRRFFKKLGLYDDKMFVGFEDFELCIRGIRLGNPINARLIFNIELTHKHLQVEKEEDKNAILMRYNINLLESSFNRIIEKHSVILEGDWKKWVSNQLKVILSKSNRGFNDGWKQWIPKKVKKTLKKIFYPNSISTPHSCSLYMTDRCNLKCTGCYRSVIGINKSNEMKLDTVKKLLALYPYIDSFCVAGLGEPALCHNFVEIIDFLKKNRKYVGIITNGTNFDKYYNLAYEPDYVSISLKGYDNKSYLVNCGVEAFTQVIENYVKLKSKFENVGFSYILSKSNYKDLEELLPLCDKLKPKFLDLTNYLVYNPNVLSEIKKIITIEDAEIISYINKIFEGREYVRTKPIYINPDEPSFNCKSYDYTINLDGEGNIGGCQRQIPPNISFGNVLIDKDPYNSSEMRKLRNLVHNKSYPHKECRYCFGNWEIK